MRARAKISAKSTDIADATTDDEAPANPDGRALQPAASEHPREMDLYEAEELDP